MKTLVEQYTPLLALNGSISTSESEKRASIFLHAMAQIINAKHELNEEKIKISSVHTATYAEQLSKGTKKTMTENKTEAEASVPFINSREALERIENDIAFLKAYYDVFNNAHVLYRQLAKGDNF